MSVSACITSVSGPVLLAEERAFLRDAQPWGVILMGRSCVSKAQVTALTEDIKSALGREALILIDQEGGRVARLKAPEWPKFPAAGRYGDLFESAPETAIEASYLGHYLMGRELSQMGIHADCAPCADLRQSDTHDAIGDRSFGCRVESVTALAEAALKGLSDAGVAGVIKHMPGQGRATLDSHYDLPSVTADPDALLQDSSVFGALADQAVMGMTCHVVFESIDPEFPATVSPTVISEIIRARIGFEGLLMTDDLGMEALGGTLADRGAKALAAGCDVLLHCSGFLSDPGEILAEMQSIADAAGPLADEALKRAEAAEAAVMPAKPLDPEQSWGALYRANDQFGSEGVGMELVSNDLVTLDDDVEAGDVFSIDVSGYEGPLHLLLDLARKQKVDLLHVSILELATQYLKFIEAAQDKRIDLAADYLLMAAWLAFLKSRLLLPKPKKDGEEETSAEDDAIKLAFRLKRLDAMREAGTALMDSNVLGRDVFLRGMPEQPKVVKTTEYNTTLYHLMQSFGGIRQRKAKEAPHTIENQFVLPLESARDNLRNLSPKLTEWASLDDIRKQMVNVDPDVPPRSVTASVFSATLELTRDGDFDVRQDTHFGPLYLRGKTQPSEGIAP